MKTKLISAIVSAIVLTAFHAAAGALPSYVHGTVTVNWTVDQQKLDDVAKYPGTGMTTVTGSGSSKTTNVVQVYKDTFATYAFTSADLLALLENSLDTNFPAGAKLVSDGSNLYVTDSTGTNEIAKISSVISVTTVGAVNSGLDTIRQTYKESGTNSSAASTGSGSRAIIVNYDDSALTPKDGTTTKFEYVGISAFTSSGSETTSTKSVLTVHGSGTLTIHGTGYGTIQNTPSIISGTVMASPAGSYTEILP
ncbi:MAG TPA: hypothetical protein VMR33_10110 [Candidatus Baltobacteraceae bacterium]|jgi:hypothetical protein|nr:hypothetical protein [Candidatus Baltobacteraceae bacterium]